MLQPFSGYQVYEHRQTNDALVGTSTKGASKTRNVCNTPPDMARTLRAAKKGASVERQAEKETQKKCNR